MSLNVNPFLYKFSAFFTKSSSVIDWVLSSSNFFNSFSKSANLTSFSEILLETLSLSTSSFEEFKADFKSLMASLVWEIWPLIEEICPSILLIISVVSVWVDVFFDIAELLFVTIL